MLHYHGYLCMQQTHKQQDFLRLVCENYILSYFLTIIAARVIILSKFQSYAQFIFGTLACHNEE